MNDISKEEVEKNLPDELPLYAIKYCLDMLHSDSTINSDDFVADGLFYEELLATLILAKNCLIKHGEKES